MFSALRDTCGRVGLLELAVVKTMLARILFDGDKESYIVDIVKCVRDLAALGHPEPEFDLCLPLLNRLPHEYASARGRTPSLLCPKCFKIESTQGRR